jgi:hypothetical protein
MPLFDYVEFFCSLVELLTYNHYLEWEMLPSSSFSDWNLEKNPVSGFMTLLKNMTTNHQVS